MQKLLEMFVFFLCSKILKFGVHFAELQCRQFYFKYLLVTWLEGLLLDLVDLTCVFQRCWLSEVGWTNKRWEYLSLTTVPFSWYGFLSSFIMKNKGLLIILHDSAYMILYLRLARAPQFLGFATVSCLSPKFWFIFCSGWESFLIPQLIYDRGL